jgi:hypothetical protein
MKALEYGKEEADELRDEESEATGCRRRSVQTPCTPDARRKSDWRATLARLRTLFSVSPLFQPLTAGFTNQPVDFIRSQYD